MDKNTGRCRVRNTIYFFGNELVCKEDGQEYGQVQSKGMHKKMYINGQEYGEVQSKGVDNRKWGRNRGR
jgi:hypothetical protein